MGGDGGKGGREGVWTLEDIHDCDRVGSCAALRLKDFCLVKDGGGFISCV